MENQAVSLEIEKTYLAKQLPAALGKYDFEDIRDVYVPSTSPHPLLRIRKKGDVMTITKKLKAMEGDHSMHTEVTIQLTIPEYDELSTVPGKHVIKRRYYVPYMGKMAEIDIFLEKLLGLVLVDFEFPNEVERDNFSPPDYCLADVTQEEMIAGGFLAGRSYNEIKPFLDSYQYQKLDFRL